MPIVPHAHTNGRSSIAAPYYGSLRTGIETSMDVDTHVRVLGSARPLLAAFEHATTEMQKWLMADFGFSERGASTFMGQTMEYEIANIVDPNFTVVAKMRKSLLPRR